MSSIQRAVTAKAGLSAADCWGVALQQVMSTLIAQLIQDRQLYPVFQPITNLDTDATVGFEALARGPAGSELEMPGALFAAAEPEGLIGELDRVCRERALSDAIAGGLGQDDLLFINVEPAWLEQDGALGELRETYLGRISLVIELTERALAARPSEVLATVRWLRERGWCIALDDVGADHRSLALMPFVAPEIIKLDRDVVQGNMPAADAARVVNAVAAEAERSGALILAEGIESSAHLTRARSMGATLGQGWLLGRPGPLRCNGPSSRSESGGVPRRPPATDIASTPFELIADSRRLRRGDKHLLLALSRQLEEEALRLGSEAVVLATFQSADFFTPTSRRRYERLAGSAALVGVLGVGLDSEPAPGVRGASLRADDPLRGEWDVIVVSPHFAGAFVARDLGDTGQDMERRFDFLVTYERPLVVAAAQTLLRSVIRSE